MMSSREARLSGGRSACLPSVARKRLSFRSFSPQIIRTLRCILCTSNGGRGDNQLLRSISNVDLVLDTSAEEGVNYALSQFALQNRKIHIVASATNVAMAAALRVSRDMAAGGVSKTLLDGELSLIRGVFG